MLYFLGQSRPSESEWIEGTSERMFDAKTLLSQCDTGMCPIGMKIVTSSETNIPEQDGEKKKKEEFWRSTIATGERRLRVKPLCNSCTKIRAGREIENRHKKTPSSKL